MDDPIKRHRQDLTAAQQAAEWLERLKNPGPGDNAEFVRWLKESRANVREMLLASAWEVTLRGIDTARKVDIDKLIASASANVIPVREAAGAARRGRSLRWPVLAGIGLAVASVAAVVFASWTLRGGWGFPNEYTTSVGEQRTVALVDGSVVALNTQSKVRVKFSESARDLYLSSGQAIFAVAHDASRPFRVHVGSAIVQAIGTKFDVRRIGDRTSVVVIEGKVQISPEGMNESVQERLAALTQSTRLAAGQAVSITPAGITVPAPVDVADVTAWQQRRLKFRYSTLEEVVEEFNRYNRTPQIRIEGQDLRARPISGVFEADDPESLISSLAADNTIAVERSEDEFVIRPRSIIVQSGSE